MLVAGGADVAQQVLGAGLLDELQLHVVADPARRAARASSRARRTSPLERTRVLDSPAVTHLRYRVAS